MNKLTEKELQVFKKIYFRCLTQQDTALELCVSQQCVSQYLANIEKKWEKA
jgi:DNA-directed RNA polymerase specialized sigma subunit